MTRISVVQNYLSRSKWSGWMASDLAGDASTRRYMRLESRDGKSLILMDAPDASKADLRRFVDIAGHLNSVGLAAPAIVDADTDLGIIVMQDFGNDLFATVLRRAPGREYELYALATDVLLELHRHPPKTGLPMFQTPLEPEVSAIAYAWYMKNSAGEMAHGSIRFCDTLNRALTVHANDQSVTVLRDYHAENLVLRAEKSGLARAGLLDFQDAMAGHPAYDLVSLLTDARRDVLPETRDAVIARYLAGSGSDRQKFEAAYAVLGAQRNLRILGVFSRLCLVYGKQRYVDLIPRVWKNLLSALMHGALSDLRGIVLRDFPAPTMEHLEHLRSRCATVPEQ